MVFHYAFKVKDIESTVAFYHGILGCGMGRSTETWIDFNFFGHQLSAHISDTIPPLDFCGKVDGIAVPMPHFGALLDRETFLKIEQKLLAANIEFIIPPYTRYEGQTGEQRTMFLLDFSGNPIEFKSFTREEEIFS